MAANGANAFEVEITPLLPRLRSVAYRLVTDRALAEDAVQEALLRAYRFRDQRRDHAAWPWLRQVLIRECWRVLRRRSSEPSIPVPDELWAGTAGPDEQAIRAEEYAEVRRAVEQIPAGYQRVLRLRHGAGLGERAVAAIVGLPLGTVQWRLKRAHDHLRLVLTHHHAPPLAATLREVARQMQIRVTTEEPGPVPLPGPGVDYSGTIRYEVVTAEVARAAIPPFHLPESVLAAHPGLVLELGRRGPDAYSRPGAVHNISAHAPGHRLLIECNVPEEPREPLVSMQHFPGAEIGVDEDTQVGGRPGHWTTVNRRHNLWWTTAAGAGWRVAGEVAPEEIRRIAEAIEAEAASTTV